jgi:hypothetical protein
LRRAAVDESSTSAPTTISSQAIPATDNPNTLKESIQAERAAHPERAGYYDNDPCLTGCERDVRALYGHGPGGMTCTSERNVCMARCPAGRRSDGVTHP